MDADRNLRPHVLLPWLALACANPVEVEILSETFRSAHCYDCHDAEVQKGGLNLEALSTDLRSEEALHKWIRVYDRIRNHEMPPRDKLQPSPELRKQTLSTMEPQLHEASLKHRKSGRAGIRRLNRSEYENTLHDLLDIAVALKPMLPEDNRAEGFDKVGTALGTSATHLVRYQETADLALAHALPPGTIDVRATQQRMTGRQWLEKKLSLIHI